MTASDLARFHPKVERRRDGCHEWIGGRWDNGYGRFSFDGSPYYAHRVAYAIAYGECPTDVILDHTCRNRWCVNPEHLEPLRTLGENLMRSPDTQASINAAKTQCIRGHDFDQENTYIKPNGNRGCRRCRKTASDAHYARKTGRS